MSVGPAPDVATRTSSRTGAQAFPQSHLAALLTEAYKELEVQRVEASLQRGRAVKAEKLVQTLTLLRGTLVPSLSPVNNADGPDFSPSISPATANTARQPFTVFPSSPKFNLDEATRLVLEYQERANHAEQERDEAIALRVAICDDWNQLHSYLIEVDKAAADARLGFDRIVKANGGQLVIAKIHAPPNVASPLDQRIPHQPTPTNVIKQCPPLSLPPIPVPSAPTTRRKRTSSLETHISPPATKRLRGEFLEPSHGYPSPSQHFMHTHAHPPPYIHGISPSQHQTSRRMTFPSGPSSSAHDPPSASSSRAHDHTSSHCDQSNHHNHLSRSEMHRNLRKSCLSRSSDASMSVDEMLLEITDGSPPEPAYSPSRVRDAVANAANLPCERHSEETKRKRGHDSSQKDTYEYSTQSPLQGRYPDQRPALASSPPPMATSQDHKRQTRAGTIQRQSQTHVFAPVITGAPVKKARFPGSAVPPVASSTSSAALRDGPGDGEGGVGGTYPPTNEKGQRICRRCGMPGRYKENKCVEKWGPGPLGPGTVCDRCRKKMKRIERRGTLDMHSQRELEGQHVPSMSQVRPHASQSQDTATSTMGSGSSPSQATIHRTDTLLVHQSPVSGSQLRHTGEDIRPYPSPRMPRMFQTGSPHPRLPSLLNQPESATSQLSQSPSGGGSKRPPLSPKLPRIVVLNDDNIDTSAIGGGSEAAFSARGDGSSAGTGNHRDGGVRAVTAIPKRPGQEQGGGSKTGSRKGSRSPVDIHVCDEPGAEVDSEPELEVEAVISMKVKGPRRIEADAEAYLLEAAEANSVSSSAEET